MGCGYLVLTDALVPEPLTEDFIFKSSGAPHNTLLDVGNGGGVLHDFNHPYNVNTECKYHTVALVFTHICPDASLTYSVSSGDAAIR